MEIIDDKDLERIEPMPLVNESYEITEEKFKHLLKELENPVIHQKELAVKLKCFLDVRIEKDLIEKGTLTDSTRRWVETYNNTLEKLQKALYGEKSVNLHVHKVTHSQIAARMRQYKD